eukprot:COSAG03_NODE_6131_length_1110_cov_2.171118_3_plen_67_part_01
MLRAAVAVPKGLGLTSGPLIDDVMCLLRGKALPVWDVQLADLWPDGWRHAMLPMALSLPLELQEDAV